MTPTEPPTDPDPGRDERGQTLNDFVVGVALFLFVVAYTFAFLPTVFQPFADPGGSETKRADRTADLLVADLLAENVTDGGDLDEACTRAFFDNASATGCRFTRTTLPRIAAVPETTTLNVTVRRGGSVVTDGGTRLARGPTTSQAPAVARAVRITTYDGKDVRVVVRAW